MPLFAVLTAAPEVRHCKYSAHLHPLKVAHREERRHGDIETAIAVKVRRVLSVELQALLVRDEHRHAGAVFARVEDLFGFVISRIEIHLRLAKHSALTRSEVVAIDQSRRDKAAVSVERLIVFAPASEAERVADARQLQLTHKRSLQIVEFDQSMCVFAV